jgi:hypothetical protein
LLQFYLEQPPGSDPRYQYGMVRVSSAQPNWVPPDAGLVDHMFLLFGLVESLDADFFADRVFPALAAGDYNASGAVDVADYELWGSTFGSATRLAADGNSNGVIDAGDYVIWRNAATSMVGSAAVFAVPEPISLVLAGLLIWIGMAYRAR